MIKETSLQSHWKWYLTVVGFLLYLPLLLLEDLNNDEAIYGLLAQTAMAKKQLFSSGFLGQNLTPDQPLYSILVNFCCLIFGDVNSLTVRLPSVLALAMMVTTAAVFNRHHSGREAAVTSGAMVLTCMGAFVLGTHSHSYVLGASLVAIAWVLWFEYSREKRDWTKAWAFSLSLVFLAVLSCGMKALFMFYLPLFFLKKPTDVRKRLFRTPHVMSFIGLTLALIIFYSWQHNLTREQIDLTPSFQHVSSRKVGIFENWAFRDSFTSYPFALLLFLFPWLLFCWAPFCEAFKRVEVSSHIFHYFRRLSQVPFVIFWLVPNAGVLYLLPSLVAVSVMTGLHYGIVVRRHAKVIRNILGGLIVIVIAGSLVFGCLTWYMFKVEGDSFRAMLIALPSVALPVCVWLFFKRNTLQLWNLTMLTAAMFFWVTFSLSAISFEDEYSSSRNASILLKELPKEQKAFYMGKLQDFRHYAEFFYMDGRVALLEKNLPAEELDRAYKVVYVISKNGAPIGIHKDPAMYTWESFSEEVKDQGRTLQLWKGVKR